MSEARRGGEVAVRPYRRADREAIGEITRLSWGEMTAHKLLEDRFGPVGTRRWDERKCEEVLAFCDRRPGQVLVAETGGRVVGYASYVYEVEDEIGSVSNNAVLPEFRGRGIGRRLVRSAVDALIECGARILRVSTLGHDAPARHVYEGIGFREFCTSVHYVAARDDVEPQAQGDAQ